MVEPEVLYPHIGGMQGQKPVMQVMCIFGADRHRTQNLKDRAPGLSHNVDGLVSENMAGAPRCSTSIRSSPCAARKSSRIFSNDVPDTAASCVGEIVSPARCALKISPKTNRI